MNKFNYFDLLATLNIEDAHPGGFELTKEMMKFLPLSSNSNVLEVGCGSGHTACYIYEQYKCSIVTIELNEQMLINAKKRFNRKKFPIQLYKANAERLPFRDNSFDIIISESVTSFTNIDQSLTEYERVLKEGGYLLAIEMTSERPLTNREQIEIENVYGITKTRTVNEWEKHFKKAGFYEYKIINGNTIINTPTNPTQSLPFHKLPPEGIELLHKFQELIYRYKNVLGHRVFLCKKTSS
jgi:ubiquinone/menaquinone biosynthesis C-methylase UbiE